MAILKKFLKSKPICKATFSYEGEAENVALVGDFNEWDTQIAPLKKDKEGVFKITLDLPIGAEYEYRFLVDGNYVNDPDADKYYFNYYAGEDNSVISV